MKTFKEAVKTCHISGYIFRLVKPNKVYGKNHPIPLEDRVPVSEQKHNDWCEYDPEEDYGHF